MMSNCFKVLKFMKLIFDFWIQNRFQISIQNSLLSYTPALSEQKMNSKNFLLGFLGTSQSTSIKGKNPNPSSKLIKSKASTIKPNEQKEQSKKQLSSKDKKSATLKQIQKLQKQLQSATQNIEETEKKLDTDLFLKKQKQKRLEYAKNLNQEYEIQKKKREEMLYKKYRGGEKNEEQNQSGLEQTKNIKTDVPLELIKILEFENRSISKSKSIVNGHHYTAEMLGSDEKMMTYEEMVKEERELLFGQSAQENAQSNINDENSNKITLMPLKKIAQNMLNIQYFPIDFSKPLLQPTQQYQTLMSALTLLPQHLSSKYFLTKQINKNSYFLCKVFLNGQKKTAITSDLIETREFAHYHINLHSKMADNRSFGPTILEKCFRKVSANLEYPDLNCAIFALFGVDPEIINISNRNYLKDNFEMVIKWLMTSGQVVGFMNDNGHNTGIYENRIYRLKEVVDAVELTQEQLQQTKKKKKDKKNKDTEPENIIPAKQVARKTLYHFQNPYKGTLLDPKGLNNFQLLQVFQKFNKLILIRDYSKPFTCKRINLQLFSLCPLSMTNNQWTKNNQYHFTVTSPLSLRIVMRKVHLSTAEAMVKRQMTKEEDYETNNLYGFLVFLCKEGEEKITCMKLDSLICKTKSNDSLEWPSYCQKFQKGSYIIIPYSNKVTKTTFQLFNLDFFIQKPEALQFGKAIINEWKWIKQPNSGHNQKVIQSLENREYVQKTKIEEIEIPKISPSGVNPEKLLESMVDKDKLMVTKGYSLKDLLIPGKIAKFLVNPDIEIATKPNKTNRSKGFDKSRPRQALTKNQQIQSLQKQQCLQTLLGYDLLQGEDINRGLMGQFLQSNEQVFDFEHYGLGSEGLTAIMETLMQCPSIRKLNLGHNELDDSAVVFLCYYLDKANRVELQELDLRGNCFGKIGLDAVKGIMARYTKLNVVY